MNKLTIKGAVRGLRIGVATVTVLAASVLLGCSGGSAELSNDDDFKPPVFIEENTNSGATVLNAGQSANFDLGAREYRLAMPSDYDPSKAYKLLMAFHGSGSYSTLMMDVGNFHILSDDYIVAYPQADFEGEEWNEGCGCNKPNRLGIDDLAYVDDVISDIKLNYAIAEGEIYGVGFSQGGLFAQNLLCNRSQTFKAIASVGSPMSLQLSETCAIEEPTSYMMVHGKKDPVLPFAGYSHPNFPLISATDAIALIAEQNKSLLNPLIRLDKPGVELAAYWNGQQKTHLYAITQGGHSWSFNDFNTSIEVLKFFDTAHQPALPEYSQFVNVDGIKLQVRTMGQEQSNKPTLVLLSGPNQNFHADSAWFASTQQYLAEHYKVISVDRAGNGWSDFDAQTSYVRFAGQLKQVLTSLGEQHVVLVAFASSNISATVFESQLQNDSNIDLAGMVWIDPDVLQPFSIAFYQDYPVSFYRERLVDLLPHLETGAWTERTFDKIMTEKSHVQGLVGDSPMDWHYFDLMLQQRLLIGRQQSRAIEIAHYHDDLEAMKEMPLITQTPISVIDSDFELAQIEAFPDAADTLTQWMEEGTVWYNAVATASGGHYIEVQNSDHLMMFERPQVILEAVNQLLE